MNDQWKLVPIEPTSDMVIDGFEAVSEFEDTGEFIEMSGCQRASESAKVCYAAMLAACPVAPTGTDANTALISRVFAEFRKDACVSGDDRVSEAFIKAGLTLLGAAGGADARLAAVTNDGYAEAFYAIATALGISARNATPKEVFEREMLPMIERILTIPEKWELSVHDSDGRVWLRIKHPIGAECLLSAAATIDEGRTRTIAAQVLDELGKTITDPANPAASALQKVVSAWDSADASTFVKVVDEAKALLASMGGDRA